MSKEHRNSKKRRAILTAKQIEYLQDCEDSPKHEVHMQAEREVVSTETIHSRRYRIYKRLGVHNIDDAVKKAKDLGLILPKDRNVVLKATPAPQ